MKLMNMSSVSTTIITAPSSTFNSDTDGPADASLHGSDHPALPLHKLSLHTHSVRPVSSPLQPFLQLLFDIFDNFLQPRL